MDNIEKLAKLCIKYESNGDPAVVSSGYGDYGGRSYGLYQFSSSAGVVDDFIKWLKQYPEDCYANYGRVLYNCYPINSSAFVNEWQSIGTIDPGGFGNLQSEYTWDQYYIPSKNRLANNYFNMDKHSDAMKAVLFSRSVQYGSYYMPELFNEAVWILGYPNLSYVDDSYFDPDMITAIYDFLAGEAQDAIYNGGHSSKDWCNGSIDVCEGLYNRFLNEKNDALNMCYRG